MPEDKWYTRAWNMADIAAAILMALFAFVGLCHVMVERRVIPVAVEAKYSRPPYQPKKRAVPETPATGEKTGKRTKAENPEQ
jgi:hypothetical protein